VLAGVGEPADMERMEEAMVPQVASRVRVGAMMALVEAVTVTAG